MMNFFDFVNSILSMLYTALREPIFTFQIQGMDNIVAVSYLSIIVSGAVMIFLLSFVIPKG